MIADKKLARVLKELSKTGAKGGNISQVMRPLNELIADAFDPALKSAIVRLSQALQTPADQSAQLTPEDAAALLRSLQDNGLPNSAAVTFAALIPALKNLDLETVLPLTPNVRCLAAWAKGARLPKKALETKILTNPELAWSTPALDWYIENASPHRAPTFLSDLLTKRPRPNHLSQWDELLPGPIKDAKGGPLLQAILEDQSRDQNQLDTLAALAISKPDLSHHLADLLPDLLDGPCARQALAFTRLFLEHAALAPQHQLPTLAAAIARLATGLLVNGEPSDAHAQALASIRETMARLKISITDEELRTRVWILEPIKAAAERLTDNQNLTLIGARYLAVAFEKARQGFAAKVVLSMTAKNLGMTALGAAGERTTYNPLHHQDTKGGIMPGESVEVTDPGWLFRNSVVLRATVARPAATPSFNTL
jgi:hypothetical protein